MTASTTETAVSTTTSSVANAVSLFARMAVAIFLGTLGLVANVAAAQGRPDVRWTAAGHSDRVTSVEFSPDGSLMATSSEDKTIKLWTYPQGGLSRTLVATEGADTGVTGISAVHFTPDGTHVDGLAGLRNYLLTQRKDQMLRYFCRKLLGYALGRGVQLSDQPLVDEMLVQLAQHDYRFTAAVETIVRSQQFRYHRGAAAVDVTEEPSEADAAR